MAYNLRNINVLDLRPSTGVGVALPFSSRTAFRTVYTTKEQLKYNITNYLLTGRGERIFNPTFGAGIRERLFEQISEEANESLRLSIQTSVESYFPSIEVVDLAVTSNSEANLISVLFTYRIKQTGESDNILLNVQNG